MSIFGNELPRSIKDIPHRYSYEGKKIWTILGKNKRVVGNLNLKDDSASVKFELQREEAEKYKSRNVKAVTAIDKGSSRITLFNSSLWESPMSSIFNRGTKTADMRLNPSLVVIQPNSNAPIEKVNNLTAYLPGVGEWFNENFLEFDMDKYQFKQRKKIYHDIELPGIAVITLYAKLTIDTDSTIMDKKFVAYPESYVSIKFDEARDVDNATNLFTYVENFFNFIFSTPHSTNVFTSDVSTSKQKYKQLLYILNPSGHKDYEREEARYENSMLFSFQDIDDVATIFVRWITQYNRIKEIVDAITLLRSVRVSEEMRFTTIINALEAVHRRYHNRKPESDEDYKKRVDEIVGQITDDENKKLVEGKLQYGNEMPLRKRLKDVYEIGEKHGIAKPSKSMTNKIIDTRNYLTHGDEARKKDALSGYEINIANALLGRYLKLLLLQILGVNDNELTGIVSSSNQFKDYYRDEPPVPSRIF